jgi:hypothetical protein
MEMEMIRKFLAKSPSTKSYKNPFSQVGVITRRETDRLTDTVILTASV